MVRDHGVLCLGLYAFRSDFLLDWATLPPGRAAPDHNIVRMRARIKGYPRSGPRYAQQKHAQWLLVGY